jgi:type II secretory pathway predicted ATPase ExeA
VLCGEVGVGKTALLYQLLRRLEGEQLVTSWIFNTMLNKEELLHAIARDFGLEAPREANVAQLVELLQAFLVEQNAADRNCAIIVDEAHNLSLPAMEALRMLSNLEVSGRKLVQILMVGQPELKERMDEPKLRQLRSRITIYRELQAFNAEETGRYVNFKLAAAGSQLRIAKAPLKLLHLATEGNTRMINLIMERSLYAALAFGEQELSVRVLRAAVDEIASCQIEVAARLGARRRRGLRLAAAAVGLVVFAGLVAPWIPGADGARSPLGLALGAYLARDAAQDAPSQAQTAAIVDDAARADNSNTTAVAESVAVAAAETQKVTGAENAAQQSGAVNYADAAQGNNSLTGISKPETDLSNTGSSVQVAPPTQEMLAFLKPFGLEGRAGELAAALQRRELVLFENVLPGGVQLLQVDRLPKEGPVPFTAFPWNDVAGENPSWLVLWEPPFMVQDFYYGYRNENILALQKLLKRLGYYWGPDDGMVGPVTWRAINSFQKDMKLKRTMWPDPETVFWLNVMSKQG